jgi:hypothetical protein
MHNGIVNISVGYHKLVNCLTSVPWLFQSENEMVFKAVQVLYSDGNTAVKTNLYKIVVSGVRALMVKKPEENVVSLVS